MTDNSGAAFPVPNDANVNGQEGLTKREWFAGMNMAAMNGKDKYDCDLSTPRQRAFAAVSDADALIAELEKDGNK